MVITLRNQIHLADAPPDIRSAITGQLGFLNPKWRENERMGRTNFGTPKYLRFYETAGESGLILPRGYMRPLINQLKAAGIDWELVDRRRTLPPVEIPFIGTLKPFQDRALAELTAKEFGVLRAPTGAGKTVIALAVIAARRQPALIVVHTRQLARQWVDRIEEFTGLSGPAVGTIGGGKTSFGDRVTVALVQSLYRRAAEAARHTGFLVVDECHRAPSRTFTEAVAAFDCRYMLGLSATPWRRDGLSDLIGWYLGTHEVRIPEDALRDRGHLIPARVIFRETAFSPYHDPVTEYSQMLSELTQDPARNALIAADVAAEMSDGQTVLVLTDRRAHCEAIRAALSADHGLDPAVLTGEVGETRRREIIDGLDAGTIHAVIATGQLIGEGFDCRRLTTLVIATPIRFDGRLVQYLGRVLRPAPGKDHARVYDYVDRRVGPLLKAAQGREQVYRGAREGL